MTWILSGLAIVVVALLGGLWWWVTRPPDHRDSISQTWRDQHGREGRH